MKTRREQIIEKAYAFVCAAESHVRHCAVDVGEELGVYLTRSGVPHFQAYDKHNGAVRIWVVEHKRWDMDADGSDGDYYHVTDGDGNEYGPYDAEDFDGADMPKCWPGVAEAVEKMWLRPTGDGNRVEIGRSLYDGGVCGLFDGSPFVAYNCGAAILMPGEYYGPVYGPDGDFWVCCTLDGEIEYWDADPDAANPQDEWVEDSRVGYWQRAAGAVIWNRKDLTGHDALQAALEDAGHVVMCGWM